MGHWITKCAAGFLAAAVLAGALHSAGEAPGRADDRPGSGRLPRAVFLENLGQWEPSVRYAARIGPGTILLEERGWTVTVPNRDGRGGATLRFRFPGGEPRPRLTGEDRAPGRFNFLLGRDPARWRSGVLGYSSIRYGDFYPGIDLRMRVEDAGLEWDLHLSPGADLSRVECVVDGGEGLALDEAGALRIETGAGPVRSRIPACWEGAGHRLAGRFVLLGRDRFRFDVPDWTGGSPLVVDPDLVFSTYLGGKNEEYPYAIRTEAGGDTILAGYAYAGFPTTPGAFSAGGGAKDGFIARLDAKGSKLVFATLLGGRGDDEIRGLVLDAAGEILVAGVTSSDDFPATPGAWDTTHNGKTDGFLARLDAGGGSLRFSTFLGGRDFDDAVGLGVDGSGAATVAGNSMSLDFPTTPGAWSRTQSGQRDIFVTRFLPDGSLLVFSTLVGGKDYDTATAMAMGPDGSAFVAGYSDSFSDFPTTGNAFQPQAVSLRDAVVFKLNPWGNRLLYSTWLGGEQPDAAQCLALAADGAAVVAGQTSSDAFPIAGTPWQAARAGNYDVFVSRLDSTGSRLVWSTFLGGMDEDEVTGLSLTAAGEPCLGGRTRSIDFPTTPGAWSRTLTSPATLYDAFLCHLGAGGSRLLYSTFLGGKSAESSCRVAAGPGTEATVAGYTNSTDFPITPGAFSTVYGYHDLFITRLPLLPAGVRRFGAAVPSCRGEVTIYALDAARAGWPSLGLACAGAPPSTAGFLLLGLAPFETGIPVLGIRLFLDPTPGLLALPVGSDGLGASTFTSAGPPLGTRGAAFCVQYLWLNTAACGGSGTLSASDALGIKVL